MNAFTRFPWWALVVIATVGPAWGQQSGSADTASGAVLWANTCDRCHNARDPQEFRDDQWRVIVSHMRVRAGLTGADAREVLAFLQASNQPTPVRSSGPTSGLPDSFRLPESRRVDTTAGAAVYQRTCIACHSANGRGALPGVADLTDRGGVLAKADMALAESIWNGYQTSSSTLAMPAKGGDPFLTEQDVRSVIAYIRETFGGDDAAD